MTQWDWQGLLACSIQDYRKTNELPILGMPTPPFFLIWICGERWHRKSVISGEIWMDTVIQTMPYKAGWTTYKWLDNGGYRILWDFLSWKSENLRIATNNPVGFSFSLCKQRNMLLLPVMNSRSLEIFKEFSPSWRTSGMRITTQKLSK